MGTKKETIRLFDKKTLNPNEKLRRKTQQKIN